MFAATTWAIPLPKNSSCSLLVLLVFGLFLRLILLRVLLGLVDVFLWRAGP